jgi:hypothetical protein
LSVRIPYLSDLYDECPNNRIDWHRPPRGRARKPPKIIRPPPARAWEPEENDDLWRPLTDDDDHRFSDSNLSRSTRCHLSINHDASIITRTNIGDVNSIGGDIWMKPTIDYIDDEVKLALSKVKGGGSPRRGTPRRKHKRPPKPEQQRRQQTLAFSRSTNAQDDVRRRHYHPYMYSIKYTVVMNHLIPFIDGRWLASYGNTIYWIPVHDHNRMKLANEHYQDSWNKYSKVNRSAKRETPLERNKRMDEYADVFARLPENAMIESMYALDGNVYGIATDLVITLVKLLSPSVMTMNEKHSNGIAPNSNVDAGIKWQWMIWSISSPPPSSVTSIPAMSSSSVGVTSSSSTLQSSSSSSSGILARVPMSVWTLPPHDIRYCSSDRNNAYEIRPLCIEAASTLANAFSQLRASTPADTNEEHLRHRETAGGVAVAEQPTFIETLPKEDQSILRFTLLPKPVSAVTPPVGRGAAKRGTN